ncbi:MAG: hypothetical protein P8O07_02365 [Crocinitomicaceae bacterium]|nr:hypothetical protein [Crocinitomicaceae bacterium]
MKSFISLFGIYMIIFLNSGCTNSESGSSSTTNNDPELVGKWIRKNKYHLDLYSNGIGSKDKNVVVTDDIKKFKKERINWASFNDNFLLINTDEEVIGFSYQVKGDTLFLRQPEDNLEFFIRVRDEKNESTRTR